jgi:hypothetical protein
MTKEEEIAIIFKRIPKQRDYLRDCTSNYFQLYYMHSGLPDEVRDKLFARQKEVYTSALGVFDNLIKRLEELINDKGKITNAS